MNPRALALQYSQIAQAGEIESANNHELIKKLIEGAISRVRGAALALSNNDIPSKGLNVSKAISIVEYLRVCLEPGADPVFTENLVALYSYIERRLFEANAANDEQGLAEVLELLRQIEEGWSAIPMEYRS